MKLSFYPFATGLLSSLLFGGSVDSSRTALALLPDATSLQPSLQAQYQPPSSGNVGDPTGSNSGAASRGDCLKSEKGLKLTALTSRYTERTVFDRPSLWFYIPYALSHENWVRFSLLRADDRLATNRRRWQVIIPAGTVPGVIQVQIPPDAALEVNKEYKWALEVSCRNPNSEVDPDKAGVYGFMKRIVPSAQLSEQLRKSQSRRRNQMLIYKNNKIWFDALNTLAELRKAQPQDPILLNDWRLLLKSVGVEGVSNMPLRSCCTLLEDK